MYSIQHYKCQLTVIPDSPMTAQLFQMDARMHWGEPLNFPTLKSVFIVQFLCACRNK